MAELAPIALATQSAPATSHWVTLERLKNMYPSPNPGGSKSPVALYPTPGLLAWATIGDGPIRGLHVMGGFLWVVSGSELYRVTRNQAATLVGQISGAGNVHMADNGTHVAILTAGDAYAANASGMSLLSESNLGGATYQDGYGIFTKRGTESFYITALDDMTSIDALDFSTADVFADNLVTCLSDHRELWLFGQRSTEVWSNTGDASFPFSRSAFVERGCAAEGSVAKADNSVFWLGDDYKVYRAQGYQPERISTQQIEKLISDSAAPSSAWSFVYDQDGHKFLVLNFSDLSLGYDIGTNRWHERSSKNLTRWRASHHAEFGGKQLVGDFENGKIYELSPTTYTDDGDTIRREVTLPPLHANTLRASLIELRLDVEPGVGLDGAGQGSDPRWMLDWTDDGGHGWSNELWATPGGLGDYCTQVRWHALGSFRTRTLRFSISDPVRPVILGAYARIEGGSE